MFSREPLPPHNPENFHLGRCPDCGGLVAVRSNIFLGEVPCPSCRERLWFVQVVDVIKLFPENRSLELKERVLQFWEDKLELPRENIINCPDVFQPEGIESLTTVEMIMEFEEDFGGDFTFGENDETL